MKVSEVFHSIQGEGSLCGMPSTFIRLALCNLSCSWCDAAYTWKGKVEWDEVPIEELVAQVEHAHVVLTGGEPTYAEGFGKLCRALSENGHHVTVETNGTIWPADALRFVDLWSVSPKLGSSLQGQRLDPEVLGRFMALGRGVQLKFVIDGEEDFKATAKLLRLLEPVSAPVFMQPNGLCHVVVASFKGTEHGGEWRATDTTVEDGRSYSSTEEGVARLETPYLDRLRWLYDRAVQADAAGEIPCRVRVVPQTHKLAWGNKRGY